MPANRTDETVCVDVAWWGAEPTKTVTTLERNARGLGWSWVTSSTLVSIDRWPTGWRVVHPVSESELLTTYPMLAPHPATDDGARYGYEQAEDRQGEVGGDLTRIDGIDVSTAMTIVSEIGTDMRRFPSDKHFASWLGLCPGTYISGGKSLGSATKHSTKRATQALKQAAAALRTSQSALGAYFRRLCGRKDKAKAVTAAAHKLARLVYAMLTKGEEYTDQGPPRQNSRPS